MTVMTNRFYAPKGRHIVITLPVLNVPSVECSHHARSISRILFEVGMPKFVCKSILGSWSIV